MEAFIVLVLHLIMVTIHVGDDLRQKWSLSINWHIY